MLDRCSPHLCSTTVFAVRHGTPITCTSYKCWALVARFHLVVTCFARQLILVPMRASDINLHINLKACIVVGSSHNVPLLQCGAMLHPHPALHQRWLLPALMIPCSASHQQRRVAAIMPHCQTWNQPRRMAQSMPLAAGSLAVAPVLHHQLPHVGCSPGSDTVFAPVGSQSSKR